MICHSCQTMYPDMCNDCLSVISMDFSGVIHDDVKAFENFSATYTPKKVYQTSCGRINIASGEDMPLLLEHHV